MVRCAPGRLCSAKVWSSGASVPSSAPCCSDGAVLARCQVAEWLERLWSLPLAERRKLPGLPPERADVILTGALIYDAVMDRFGFGSLRITTRGLRYAALFAA